MYNNYLFSVHVDVRTSHMLVLYLFISDHMLILYPFISNQSIGGWSTEGIVQDNDPTLPVLCHATHLTSFCVLVSTEEFEVLYVIGQCNHNCMCAYL